MQLINENRETPRERRRYARLQQRRRQKLPIYHRDLRDLPIWLYLLGVVVWAWLVVEVINELSR